MNALKRCMLAWWTGYVLWGLAWAGSVHDFNGRCESCHLAQTGDGEQVFVYAVDTLCRSCHEVAQANSHPSSLVIERALPPEFPLDMDGRMTCATCHNPCLTSDRDNPYLLRRYDGVEGFCRHCHSDSDACSGVNESLFDLTHAKAWTPPGDDAGLLDTVTLDCLSCHDGSTARTAQYVLHRSVSPSHHPTDAIHANHPIGQDYARAASDNPRLRSLDDLSPMISLLEGKVGCASCHSPYSQESHHLVFSNHGGALCQECHLI